MVDIYMEFIFILIIYTIYSWYLPVQIQYWKHQNNVRHLFKVKKKDT